MNRMAFDGLNSSEGDWRFVRLPFFGVCGTGDDGMWMVFTRAFLFVSIRWRRGGVKCIKNPTDRS